MKRLIAFILTAACMLSLTACGGGESTAKEVDLNALYETILETTPEMMLVEDNMRLNLLGIQEEDCAQVITAICADALRTDEIWLVEAVDADALERISAMAESRLGAKADESITYSPEQYAVVEKAEMVTEGLYFVLIVSPDVDTLKDIVQEALQ